jgi:putative hemolysin
LAIFLLLIGNGLFAMAEITVVTARTSLFQDMANKGSAKARVALELANA